MGPQHWGQRLARVYSAWWRGKLTELTFLNHNTGLPWWLSSKEPTCQCRRYERWVRSLGQEDPLEKETATHSSILAWEIAWTEEPSGLLSNQTTAITTVFFIRDFFKIFLATLCSLQDLGSTIRDQTQVLTTDQPENSPEEILRVLKLLNKKTN